MSRDLSNFMAALNRAHEADPKKESGQAAESLYAQRVEAWVRRLVPEPSPALELACACQHLERWAIPRQQFPTGKAGYFQWRQAVQGRQAARCLEILAAAGCPEELARQVAELAGKSRPLQDPEAQALEDAACLVFLERELQAFMTQHGNYSQEKFSDILGKVWKKMSPAAKELAKGLSLPVNL